jgi:site-specific DNA recombinase
VPCPSASDPGRNSHRPGTGWTLGTVTTTLGNPRYTGHQVWNRQRTDKDLADPADVSLGHKNVQRWNLPDGWVISRKPAHEALVSEADYIAAQDVNATRGPSPRADPAGPEKRRPKKAHIREDRILPHLEALHLLLTEPAGGPRRRRTRRGTDVRYQTAEEVREETAKKRRSPGAGREPAPG